MGKNLYKQRLIFFMYMYETFLLFSYLVSRHRHTQALLSSVRDTITHTHESGNYCKDQSFLNFINYLLFYSAISGVKDRE